MRNFSRLLTRRMEAGKFVCVGLDLDIAGNSKDPGNPLTQLLLRGMSGYDAQVTLARQIIDATYELAAAYKPNSAFFEGAGAEEGMRALRTIISYIRMTAPAVPVILDFKRGDIGNTNGGYADFAFEDLQADAVTIHAYMGMEAMYPFLTYEGKGVFVLCKTSNPGSGEFQNLAVRLQPEDVAHIRQRLGTDLSGDHVPLYQYVAYQVTEFWANRGAEVGLVVGATYPEELAMVRKIVGDDMNILIPGVGAQGGAVSDAVKAGQNFFGTRFLINSSRQIIFAEDPAAAASQLQFDIDLQRKHYRSL